MKQDKQDKHEGDCTIYSSLGNQRPVDGVCTCGYGLQLVREGNWSEMYSKELKEFIFEKEGRLERGL